MGTMPCGASGKKVLGKQGSTLTVQVTNKKVGFAKRKGSKGYAKMKAFVFLTLTPKIKKCATYEEMLLTV